MFTKRLLMYRILFYMLMLCIITVASCTKETKTTPQQKATVTYNFSYSGILKVGDTIHFNSTALGTSNFLWKFGDGTTATDSTPYHIYTTSDSFIVTLIINNDSTNAIHKTLHINSDSIIVVTYDFNYSGNLWVGDTISFQSTAPAGSTFLWKFGDSTFSTLATPIHIYTSIPYIYPSYYPDTVILIVNNDTVHPVKKALQITPGIQRAAYMRTWKLFHYYGYPNNPMVDTLADTTFAINVISDIKINVLGTDLLCNNMQSYGWPPAFYYTTTDLLYNPIILSYNYPSNNVSIKKDVSGGALGGVSYYTYTSQ